MLLETNVDDLDPRLWPDVLAALLAAGAVRRLAHADPDEEGPPGAHPARTLSTRAVDAVRAEIFRRTSTLGVRSVEVGKTALDRDAGWVTVGGERIATKRALLDGVVVNVSVEYEDVRRAADALGLPVKEVLRAATSAAYEH